VEGGWAFSLPVPEHGEIAGLEQAFEIWAEKQRQRRRVYEGRIRWGYPCEVEVERRGSMVVESGTREIVVRLTNPTDTAVTARAELDLPPGVTLVGPSAPQSDHLPAGATIERRGMLQFEPTPEAASRIVEVKAMAGDRLLATSKVAFSPAWSWIVVGPFPAGSRAAHRLYFGPEAEHGPEVTFATSAGPVRWQIVPQEHLMADGDLDFSELLGRHDRVAAYVLTRLRAERSGPAELHIGSDDTFAVWLNGVQVASRETYRAAAPDQDVVPIELQAGENVLVMKVAQDIGDWKAFVRLSGPGNTDLHGVHDAFADLARYAAARPPAERIVESPKPRRWRIAGPIQRLPNDPAVGVPPELLASMRSAADWPPALPGLTWQDWIPEPGSDGTIDLTDALGPQCYATAYAATQIVVETETPVEIVSGADGGLRLWLNGELVLDAKEPRTFVFDMYRVPATLRPGRNRLLAMVNQKCGNWLFRTEILDRSKRPARPVE
jgi:hypothetical protein